MNQGQHISTIYRGWFIKLLALDNGKYLEEMIDTLQKRNKDVRGILRLLNIRNMIPSEFSTHLDKYESLKNFHLNLCNLRSKQEKDNFEEKYIEAFIRVSLLNLENITTELGEKYLFKAVENSNSDCLDSILIGSKPSSNSNEALEYLSRVREFCYFVGPSSHPPICMLQQSVRGIGL